MHFDPNERNPLFPESACLNDVKKGAVFYVCRVGHSLRVVERIAVYTDWVYSSESKSVGALGYKDLSTDPYNIELHEHGICPDKNGHWHPQVFSILASNMFTDEAFNPQFQRMLDANPFLLYEVVTYLSNAADISHIYVIEQQRLRRSLHLLQGLNVT